jgi:hypothetical protein
MISRMHTGLVDSINDINGVELFWNPEAVHHTYVVTAQNVDGVTFLHFPAVQQENIGLRNSRQCALAVLIIHGEKECTATY